MTESNEGAKNNLPIISVVILVVFLGLVFFLYSRAAKKGGGIVFPAGLNYTGEGEAPTQPARPEYNWSEISATTDYIPFVSVQRQYVFEHPAQIIPLVFPGWEADGVTFDVSEAPAQFNIMALVEKPSTYDSQYVGDLEGFAENYWTFFGGLEKLNEIEEFETESGLAGYRASYQTTGKTITGDNFFFAFPGENDKVLHVANVFPAEAESVFMRILNTFTLDVPDPSPTPAE